MAPQQPRVQLANQSCRRRSSLRPRSFKCNSWASWGCWHSNSRFDLLLPSNHQQLQLELPQQLVSWGIIPLRWPRSSHQWSTHHTQLLLQVSIIKCVLSTTYKVKHLPEKSRRTIYRGVTPFGQARANAFGQASANAFWPTYKSVK